MYRNRMKKLFTLIAAGLLALLSFNSCGIHYNDEFGLYNNLRLYLSN